MRFWIFAENIKDFPFHRNREQLETGKDVCSQSQNASKETGALHLPMTSQAEGLQGQITGHHDCPHDEHLKHCWVNCGLHWTTSPLALVQESWRMGDQSVGTRNLRLACERIMTLCCHSSDYRQTLLWLGCEVSNTWPSMMACLESKYVETSGGKAAAVHRGKIWKVWSLPSLTVHAVSWLRKTFFLSTPEIFMKHVGLHW